MPALKKTRVWPSLYFSLSSLTMSITAWAAALSFLALATADGNSGKHTVALVLVHHKAGLHTSRLLVGVGHHATDEVGLGLVEGGHQVVQLALEVGGHGLAALALLPVLVLGSLQGLARVVLEALNGQGVASV